MRHASVLLCVLLLSACSMEEARRNTVMGGKAVFELVTDFPGTIDKQRRMSRERYGNPYGDFGPENYLRQQHAGIPLERNTPLRPVAKGAANGDKPFVTKEDFKDNAPAEKPTPGMPMQLIPETPEKSAKSDAPVRKPLKKPAPRAVSHAAPPPASSRRRGALEVLEEELAR